jgi:hypothetical protein
MAVALVVAPALSISTAVQAKNRPDGSDYSISRYYIAKDKNGRCRIYNDWRPNSLGQYRGMARAERALELKKSVGIC